jgi:hypothetical protein
MSFRNESAAHLPAWIGLNPAGELNLAKAVAKGA